MSRDFRAELKTLVDGYLARQMSFDEFAARYSTSFIDEMPDSALNETELEVFGAVHEKAEWTSAAPSSEERGYGWKDVDEFTSWLRGHRVLMG